MGTRRVRVVVTLLLAVSLPLTLAGCGDGPSDDANSVARAVGGAAPDLVATEVSEPPADIVVGATFSVTDSTTNIGAGASLASSTRYFLSSERSKGGAARSLAPGRSVPALAAGGTSTGSVTLTVPAGTPAGGYYLLACADGGYANAETNESNNCVSSNGTVVVSGPDLRVSAMSEPPAALLLGGSFTVSDTVLSAGTLAAPASSIQFYLSTDTVRSSNDRSLKPVRSFGPLDPGAESSGTTDLTASAGTASGAYYLLGCVDVGSLITETDENNCAVSAGLVTVSAADLVSTEVVAPATAVVGASFGVTDSVQNAGDGAAGASTTRYYLSLDSLRSTDDKLLTGSRAVGTIDAGGSSTGSALVTIPTGTAAGHYRVLACADSLSAVPESNESNNCVVAASATAVIGADLVTSSVGPIPAAVPAGGSFAVADQVDNVGDADAVASVTQYVLSLDTLRNAGDKVLGGRRLVPAIAAHGSSSGSSTVMIPSGTAPGVYYLLVCADDVPRVAETSDSNNCAASATTFAVGLPDLVVDGLTASTAFPGDATTVSDSVRNVGFGAAGASTTRYYLSSDDTRSVEDPVLGTRAVEALAAGAASSGSSSFTIAPSVAPGRYFVIACADADAAVAEGNESNCVAAPLTVRDRCEGVVCGAADACHVAGVCNSATGACSSPDAPEGTACSDGNACSTADSCHAGVCTPGAPLACSDGNACTDDSCNPAVGCVFAAAPNGTSCSDGSACTVDDVCNAGTCVGGAPLACNDGNACTVDSCDPAAGCVATAVADGTGCSDGSACTLADSCQAGACVGGAPLACDDGNACTTDSCDAAQGCVATAVADGTSCSDGSACTEGDACAAGRCQAGTPLACDDGNACTTDSCDPAQGCVATAVADGTSCADADHCNGAETCQAGSCSPGAPDNGGCDPVATCTSVPDGRTCACPDGTIDTHGDGTLCSPAMDCDTVSAVATGAYHSCALLGNGTVRCWGYNSAGQVGDGTMGNFGRLTPVTVSGLSNVVALAAAQFQTCALLGDGTVRCWGDNTYGQLGDGTTTTRTTPVAVAGLSDVASLAVGDNHVCAALVDGTVKCWGNNYNAQLGTWGGGFSVTPTEVPGLTGAVQVTAAQYHTCAALLDGTARCWGANGFGQLGDGTGVDSAPPVTVFGLTNVVQVAASASHSCARLADGTVACWGRNLDGQLGDGTGNDRYAPSATVNLAGATSIATGQHHSCAVLGDGTMKCWGGSWEGQLGYGGTAGSASPLVVANVAGASRVAGGWLHTCAIDDGRVRCWGSNQFGGLGDGTTNRALVPNDPVALSCE